MDRTWLLLDVPNLVWRAFHALPQLSAGEVPTTVPFGFFRDLAKLCDSFRPDGAAFCFDLGAPLRRELYPDYKANRKPRTPEEMTARAEVKRQLDLLRTDYLTAAGCENVFAAAGYEADDLIAACCRSLPSGDRAVVVSSDRDLLQLLSGTVDVWNLRKRVTPQNFFFDHGINPSRWAEVKALAGCPSDGVVGVKGVGEKKAIHYLTGVLGVKSTTRARIREAENQQVFERNLKLTKLPFAGCPFLKLRAAGLPRPAYWRALCDELGLSSLRGRCPGGPGRGVLSRG